MLQLKVHNVHALQGLKSLRNNSIDCVVTSPPYWALRDYKLEPTVWDAKEGCTHEWGKDIMRKQSGGVGKTNVGNFSDDRLHYEVKTNFCVNCDAWQGSLGLEPTFQLYLKHLLDIFDEVKRVLKPTGTVFVNLGDTYAGSQSTNSSVKSANQFNSHLEDCYRKDALNKDVEGLPDKSLCMIPYRFAIAMQDRGWTLRNVNVWWKRNCMPSSVKDRFTVDFEPVFFFVKGRKYFFDLPREPHTSKFIDEHKQRKVDGKARSATIRPRSETAFAAPHNPAGRAMRTVWDITTQPFKEAHFATFPEALPERCIKAGCPEFVCNKCGKPREKITEPTEEYAKFLGQSWHDHSDDMGKGFGQQTRGFSNRKGNVDGIIKEKITDFSDCGCNAGFSGGVVLDPFAGAGTTCLVARKLNRQFIGFELNKEYTKMAEKRLKPFLQQQTLYEAKPPTQETPLST